MNKIHQLRYKCYREILLYTIYKIPFSRKTKARLIDLREIDERRQKYYLIHEMLALIPYRYVKIQSNFSNESPGRFVNIEKSVFEKHCLRIKRMKIVFLKLPLHSVGH